MRRITGNDGVLVLSSVPHDLDRSVASGDRPRLDTADLARTLGGRTWNRSERRTTITDRIPGNWQRAWAVRHESERVMLATEEDTGLALAFARPKGTRLVMVAHNLTTPRRRAFQRRTRWLQRVDRIIVLSRAQASYLREEVGLASDRVRFVWEKVDERFYAPRATGGTGRFVLTVGAEARDYETLRRALGRLDVPSVLVASSQWAATADVSQLPPRSTVRRGIPFKELRDLYENAAVVVVSLRSGTRYAAGVNALLEGMAMQKPLVVTCTPGLEEYLDGGRTMLTVPAGDDAELARAIRQQLDDPASARTRAEAARARVMSHHRFDGYIDAVSAVVRESALD